MTNREKKGIMHVYNELFGKPVERQGRKAKVSKRLFRMIDRLQTFGVAVGIFCCSGGESVE